jgi:hypothetical protein
MLLATASSCLSLPRTLKQTSEASGSNKELPEGIALKALVERGWQALPCVDHVPFRRAVTGNSAKKTERFPAAFKVRNDFALAGLWL